jgi:hypothetical protein
MIAGAMNRYGTGIRLKSKPLLFVDFLNLTVLGRELPMCHPVLYRDLPPPAWVLAGAGKGV